MEMELLRLNNGSSSEEKSEEDEDKIVFLSERKPAAKQLKKQLTLFNSISLVVSQIIGSGIFIAPTRALQHSGSIGLTLIFWLLGGLVSIGGGLAYIELGTMIRNSGGEYAYLREGFTFRKNSQLCTVIGNTLGFMFSWTYNIIVRPGSSAVIMLTFGRYFAQAVAGGSTPPESAVKLLAISGLMFITLINIYSVRLTAVFISFTAVVKVLALVSISAIGLWQLCKGGHAENFTNSFNGTAPCVGDIALAFYSVLWAYDGWNVLSYSVEESNDVEKNLPLGLMIGLPVVIVCYLFVNIAYFAGLTKSELLSSPATALTFGQVTLGNIGLVIFPLMVAFSTLGSTASATLTGSRVLYATARDGNFLQMFSGIHNTFHTPVPALLFSFFLSLFYILLSNIGPLIDGISSTMWIFYGLVFTGLIIMRFTKKHEYRPFKVWFIVPVLMILVSMFLVTVPIIYIPNERLHFVLGLTIVLTGVPIYLFFIWERLRLEIFNKISSKLTVVFNILLNSTTA